MEERIDATTFYLKTMHLKELLIKNFKGFKGKHNLKFENNFIFFVGDNNSGKSSIFEAIDFLKNGLPKGKTVDDIKNKNSTEDMTIEAIFQGNITQLITDFSEKKYLIYVFEENGTETIKVRRSTEKKEITQGKKTVELNEKKITLWNDETKQYENPSGVDKVFKTLLETQFVWADTNPEDISDFGSTKICGLLLQGSAGEFFKSDQWNEFVEVHKKTFTDGENSLSIRLKGLEKRIQDIIQQQYSKAEIHFNFEIPDNAYFIKSGDIEIDDGTNTSSSQKGTGMQRALALALIQVYADELCKHPEDSSKRKPLFLFIDEPETFLHPNAQKKLLSALDKISEIQQVFVTTHSPYLLRSYKSDKHDLFSCTKGDDTNTISESKELDLFGATSPTWGEINYYAYGLTSVEFHNELYGYLQAQATITDSKYEKIEEFDKYLEQNGVPIKINWIHEKSSGDITYPVTLQRFIRNTIHHPENNKNRDFTESELKESIEKLIELITNLP